MFVTENNVSRPYYKCPVFGREHLNKVPSNNIAPDANFFKINIVLLFKIYLLIIKY